MRKSTSTKNMVHNGNLLPRWLLIIPVIWSFVGGSAACLLGIAPDWLLLVSGVITIVLLATRHIANQDASNTARIIGRVQKQPYFCRTALLESYP